MARSKKYIALRYPKAIARDIETGALDEAPNHIHSKPGDRQVHAQIALCSYPGYFDPDQLYDLEADPYERTNLADDPAHATTLHEMKARIRPYLERLQHPYPLDDQIDLLKSSNFRRMANAARAFGTSHIPWWSDEKVAFD